MGYIRSPRLLQKFHIIPVILPPLGIILYYLLDPSRSSPERISGALLNIERILAIQYKGVSGGMIILITLFLSTMIFIIQESIPVIENIFISKREMEEKRIAQEYEVIFYGMRHRVKIIEEHTSVQKYC